MTERFQLIDPDRVTIGTVGRPGQRTFYLQAASAGVTYSLKLEKLQASAIHELLGDLLADLPEPGQLPTDLALTEPVEPLWTIGEIQLGYDQEADRVLLAANPVEDLLDEEESEQDSQPDTARLLISRAQAAALVGRCQELLEGSRQPCPLCGYPLDPSGHACPKTNGHGPPKL